MIYNFFDKSPSALKENFDATVFGAAKSAIATCLGALGKLHKETPVGVYAVDQVEGATITVFTYQAKTKEDPAAILESHRDYADIHVCLTGCEGHALYGADGLKVKVPWQQHNDAIFYEIPQHEASLVLTLTPGAYVVYLPGEAHLTQLSVGVAPAAGIKAVLKLPKAHLY